MARRLVEKLLVALMRLFLVLFTNRRVTGREHVPTEGPLLIIANHFSTFDIPVLASVLPYTPTFVGASELTEHGFVRLLIWANDAVLVQRGQGDRQAFKKMFGRLKKGAVLVIFPEGGVTPEAIALALQGESTNHSLRSRLDAQLLVAQPGTAYVATHLQVPILPMAMLGTEQLEGNISKFKRTDISVRIGPPFTLTLDEGVRGRAKREQLNQLSDEMMRRIAALLPEGNRGYYR